MTEWFSNAHWFDYLQLIAQVILILLYTTTFFGDMTDAENERKLGSFVVGILMGSIFYFAGALSLFLPTCG